MLLKLALLLSAICAISAEIVEIDCYLDGVFCLMGGVPEELPANATWKFNCPQNCTRMQLNNANFPRFPREIFITHQQVTYLYLTGTNFEELTYGDFFNAAKLTEFRLWDNKKFLKLRDNCFWGAFGLDSIDLKSNQVSELEGDAFNGLPLLTQLNLQFNNVSHISNDHFRNLLNLRSIFLTTNTIETIESEAFLHNTNLNFLSISSNYLKEVDLLLPFINTGTISIYGNQITKVAYRSISQEFKEFDTGAYIYLHNNKLTEVYIQPNIAAETLWLSGNAIERIDTLPVLRSVKVLDLQSCKIKPLDGQRFADKYVNVEKLQLSYNHITSFSKEMFDGLHKLEILELNYNELTEIDFPRLESLTKLELSFNSLTEFPYGEDIRDTFPALKSLDIRYNDFEDEYLAELAKTLEDQDIRVRWRYNDFDDEYLADLVKTSEDP